MANNEPQITTKRESIDVLDSNGMDIRGEGSTNLNSIFDKIEAGIKPEAAIKEVMSSKPDPDVVVEKAPKPVETKEEAPSGLDAELQKTEKQAEVPAPVQPPEKIEEVLPDELTVQPGDKPKTARRIQALLAKKGEIEAQLATTQKERDERDAKLKELESKLGNVKTADPKTEEAIQQQLAELAQYRRKYQLENDPQVKVKFDSRIAKNDELIYGTLKARQAGEGLIKLIQDEGGWARFADSDKQITMANGDVMTASEVAANILAALPYSERRAIDTAVNDQIQTKQEKERFFAEETAQATEYFKKVEEQNKAAVEQQQKYISESRKAIEEWHKKADAEYDFLKEKLIPPNSTAEEQAAIKEHNEWAQQIQAEKKKYAGSKNIQEILEAVDAGVKYHNERHVNAKLIAENKALKAKLENFKNGGRSTVRSGSIAAGSSSLGNEPKPSKPKSLEETFAAMERGENVES